ncbi:T9SS type A sorting domain-containing protein [Paracrocinitomix mangrovi]|uniref:T9SS type A sorting domain-containing protein n=1 Tax=Paracrocinitomix mangrovi TaxID=2862509 RepID=UPI001C8D9D91|nr:T9SS type A sorting domain-containing protein [Paracrocinitomix mangrovi]UKN02435.1 T9SS type A sorting domain-containing protein [Paracrocinitomix mangrovi]
MKLLVLAFLVSTSFLAISQDIWTQKDSLNGPPRANASAFVVLDNGYVVGGYDGFSKKRSMVSYDPIQDDWDNEEQLGGNTGDGLNRASAVSFQAYGFGFVCMGEGDGWLFSDLWMYDPYNDTWTQMANFPGESRTQAVAFEIDNIGFIGTGKASDFATFLKDFWSYDYLSNNWTQVADFPGTARLDAVGCTMGGKGYVGLGKDANSLPNDFYQYDPINDTWSSIASFPGTARMNAVSFANFPQLFVTTGDDGFSYLKDNWEYNYFGDSWQQVTDFPGEARSGAISFVIGNSQYVGTGFNSGTYYDDFYEYVFTLDIKDPIQIDANIYPNPTNGAFSIILSALFNQPTFVLYNSSGKQISLLSPINSDKNKFTFEMQNLTSGTYYLSVYESNELKITQPIIYSSL